MNKFYLLCLAALAFACGEPAKTAVSTTETPAEGIPVIHRFENEIRAFEKADSMASPPEDFVLFVGSSSVRMWKTISEDLAPLPVLNRGFGGSNFEDLLYFSDRIVFKYQPSAVVVYEGDNDIVSDTLQPEHVAMRLGVFQELMQKKLPGVPTYFLAVKPSIARRNLLSKAQAANQLIQEMAAQDEMLTYIDVATPMMAEDGKIRSDIFIDDSLHMNATGYGLWTEVVRSHLLP
ncbi:MAG: GDSL-type esterase/lipase family protein [Bacteroidota bacterium]